MYNPVIKCLLNHRSIRRFKADPIDDDILQLILKAGTHAASAGNLQMYSFLVLDEPEKIELFRNGFGGVLQEPPVVVISLVDLHRIKRWLEVNDANSPVLGRPAYFLLGFWDALIALHNVVIAAESLGLGVCYYGSILEFDIQEHFGTPEYVFPAGMISLGYPTEEPELSQRLPLEAVVHRNSYREFSDEEIKAFYHERERVWDRVSENRKSLLAEKGIHSIPQALAVQRFSDEITRQRSEGILRNLKRSKFTFDLPNEPPKALDESGETTIGS
jgi:FMN reductase (NADPH)